MKLSLTLACGVTDRTLALADGTVPVEGVRLNFVPMDPGELFRRQARHAEFDVAEFSVATYTILHAQGDRRLIALPVFLARRFRHGNLYVNTRAGIREPRDLVGKRMGAGEYQQTAAVWMRGILQHEYGVAQEQLEWVFGGYAHPEPHREKIPIALAPGLRYRTIAADESLDELLEAGGIDAMMGTVDPPSLQRGSPQVGRLFPSYVEVEQAYYRRTRIFPIMHLVVVKRAVYEEHPWVAASLVKGFEAAKALGERRVRRGGTLFCGLPWLHAHVAEMHALMGPDPFAYGLAANRAQLGVFLEYVREQGLVERPVTPEELFAVETRDG